MFGYVRPLSPLLSESERVYYRASYCGLCRAMGKICGASSRLTLSYDGAFLALLRIALTEEPAASTVRRCPAAPWKKADMLVGSDAVDYSATAMGVLAALKLEDDLSDERGLRRALAVISRAPARKWQRRADCHVCGISSQTRGMLDAFYRAEEENRECDVAAMSIDGAADAFGELLGVLCAKGVEGENYAIAYSVGRHVGRWIYCIDALDDMKDDAKAGRYNPIIAAFGGREPSESERLTLECVLRDESCSAADMLALADIPTDTSAYIILDNILSKSLPRVAAEVLAGTYRKPRREEITQGGEDGTDREEEDNEQRSV